MASGHTMSKQMSELLDLSERVHAQTKDKASKNKVYSLHEPHMACIAKGKAHKPYEFGSKVSVASTILGAWIVGVKSFAGNPYDGSTLKEVMENMESVTGAPVRTVFADKGYRGSTHWPETCSVLLSGRRRLSPSLARLLKRRQAIEPVLGHLKQDHRMNRNFLKGTLGDTLNALLAGVAFNFHKLLRYFRALFCFHVLVLFELRPAKQNAFA